MSSDPQKIVAALREMVRRIDGISAVLEGRSFEAFASDLTFDAAVHHHLLIIGEAARRIDADLERLLPGHAWTDIKSFGNVIRHRYDDVQPRVAYDLYANGELARLRDDCLRAVERMVHRRP